MDSTNEIFTNEYINDISLDYIPLNYIPNSENIPEDDFIIDWFIDRRPIVNIEEFLRMSDELNNTFILENQNDLQITNFNDDDEIITYIPSSEDIFASDDLLRFDSVLPHEIQRQVMEFNVTEEDKNCCICFETVDSFDICQLNCNHKFCLHCITQHIDSNKNDPRCPLCRSTINTLYTLN